MPVQQFWGGFSENGDVSVAVRLDEPPVAPLISSVTVHESRLPDVVACG